MKKLYVIGLALSLVLVACSNKKEEDKVASTPVDTYCAQYGYQDPQRCSGINGGGYGWQPYNYSYGWNNNFNNCQTYGSGWAPAYGGGQFGCYNVGNNYNNYYWHNQGGYGYGGYPGLLFMCNYNVYCPSGYSCSYGYGGGMGVCVY